MKTASNPLRTQIVEEALRYEFTRLFDRVIEHRRSLDAAGDPVMFVDLTGVIVADLDRLHEINRMLYEKDKH